jgi:hypothetical protein
VTQLNSTEEDMAMFVSMWKKVHGVKINIILRI